MAYDRLEAETAMKREENRAANQAGPAAQRALVRRRMAAMGEV